MPINLISYSLAPVQRHIEAARTTRDLWTGSFTLSWLTAHALVEASDRGATFILPQPQGSTIFNWLSGQHSRSMDSSGIGSKSADEWMISDLPNWFLVEFEGSAAEARDIAEACRKKTLEAWHGICKDVRSGLKALDALGADWDVGGFRKYPEQQSAQIDDYWEIYTSVLPDCERAVESLRQLQPNASEPALSREIAARKLAGVLAAATKQVRRFHRSEPECEQRPKCVLFEQYAQMGARRRPDPVRQAAAGPASLPPISLDGDFWRLASDRLASVRGTRIRAKDRFSAIALVKRFAWACHFSNKLKLNPEQGRFPDLATVAATAWLYEAASGDPALTDSVSDLLGNPGRWSGEWLHWPTQNGPASGQEEVGDDETQRPDDQCWKLITTLRARNKAPIPRYYAVMHLDGDRIGAKLNDSSTEQLRVLSEHVSEFSRRAVASLQDRQNANSNDYQNHPALRGTVIYAGGDDLLALMPCATALEAARVVQGIFTDRLKPYNLTCSAGMVITHAKTDFRAVLAAVREQEKRAKSAGRDLFSLGVMRRGAEVSGALIPWTQLKQFSSICDGFRTHSDRWLYQLAAVAERLRGARGAELMIDAEFHRLLRRADLQRGQAYQEEAPPKSDATIQFIQNVEDYWNNSAEVFRDRLDGSSIDDRVRLEGMLSSNQYDALLAASFLARGGVA